MKAHPFFSAGSAGCSRTSGRVRSVAVVLSVGAVIASCGTSPAAPDARFPPTVGSPTNLTITDWKFLATETTARAEATWGYLYSTSRDVTAEAEWHSSEPDVAVVTGPGRLVSRAPGDALIQVAFNGITVSRHVRVYQGESPLLVLEPDYNSEVQGSIRDVAGVPVSSASVEIIGGHNAGRTALSDANGSYRFLPPFVCGPLTARATKSGFGEATGSSVMCMEGLPPLVMIQREP
jgi:Carboxypeptidase regulatory-like domain